MEAIIRNIDNDSHARATALTLALIRCEVGSRAGLTRDKEAANPFYTEDFDNGLLMCEYFRRADLKEKVWHGNVTDLMTDTVFCFEGATLAEVRLQCVRVVRNRFEATPIATEPAATKRRYQSTAGLCRVWNDKWVCHKAKIVTEIQDHAYKYIAADGSMWQQAERITTSHAKLAGIWANEKGKKEAVKWGRPTQWIR